MITIERLEKIIKWKHERGLKLFARDKFDEATLVSMLVSEYLNGFNHGMEENSQVRKNDNHAKND